jgi:hypothetical protein
MEHVGGSIDNDVYRCPRCGMNRRVDYHLVGPDEVTNKPVNEPIGGGPRGGTILLGLAALFLLTAGSDDKKD